MRGLDEVKYEGMKDRDRQLAQRRLTTIVDTVGKIISTMTLPVTDEEIDELLDAPPPDTG